MSEKKVSKDPLNKIIYKLAYPFALLFKKCDVSPNIVTYISFFLALVAFTSLIMKNLTGYLFFWFLSYILDYADGTLARMTKNIGTSALRIDHTSDLVKILVIFLSIGIYFDNQLIWILTFLSSTIFLFYTVLSHDIYWAKNSNIKKTSKEKKLVLNNSKIFLKIYKLFLKKKKKFKKITPSFVLVFCTINGHTLLIFFFIPFSLNLAYNFLIYFIFISTLQSANLAMQLNALRRA